MDGDLNDSFYDSDQDEQMAAASTQSLYDPCSPYTPVRPNQQQQPKFLTLSGRRLSSTVCAKASQSVKEHLLTQLSPSSVPPTTPITSFIKASCYFEEAKKVKLSVTVNGMASDEKRVTWIPLESNPEAFNKYIDKMGVKGVECHELFGFEPDLVSFVPGPHFALVFCYPYQERANAYQKLIYEQLAASGNGIVPEWAFFMKQKIHNACGTFALFHALTNNADRIDIGSGYFSEWFNEAKQSNADQRSDLLATNAKLPRLHEDCALRESETNVPRHVVHHFISYITHGGRLFEFDSGQEFPRDCGPSSDGSLLIDAGKICKELMSQLEDISCNAIALCAKND